jgi:hypothetical protein
MSCFGALLVTCIDSLAMGDSLPSVAIGAELASWVAMVVAGVSASAAVVSPGLMPQSDLSWALSLGPSV